MSKAEVQHFISVFLFVRESEDAFVVTVMLSDVCKRELLCAHKYLNFLFLIMAAIKTSQLTSVETLWLHFEQFPCLKKYSLLLSLREISTSTIYFCSDDSIID